MGNTRTMPSFYSKKAFSVSSSANSTQVTLAKAAQTLTDRCVFAHDVGILAGNNHSLIFIYNCIHDSEIYDLGTWKEYGQNLAAGNYGSWNNVIQAWYDEVSQYPSNNVESYE